VRVQILHFASFRDAVGRGEETREVAPGTRVSDVWQALAAEVPQLSRLRSMPPAAVNREYVPGSTVLSDGDELAFLPPVAGG